MTFIEHREILPTKADSLRVGEVRLLEEELVIDEHDRHYFRREVEVGDESDPLIRERFFRKAETYERQLERQPEIEATYVNDEGVLVVDPRNEAAMDLYYDERGQPTQMTAWGPQMMQAIALEGLQNLSRGGRFLPGGQLDRRTLELFTNMPDGIGLRSRQHIYAGLLVERARALSGVNDLNIVSLGSGAAVPNIEATLEVERMLGKKINWQLFDLDPDALMYAEQMIRDAGIAESTFDFGPTTDVLSARGSHFEGRSYYAARHLENESLDAVDALGLWEYLDEHQAATFLKMLYPKLKKGAPMIVSNMLKSRPQPLYNQKAVGWPKLHMRNEQDLIDIVAAVEFKDGSGIPTESVTITHPQDGVYAVMEIRK